MATFSEIIDRASKNVLDPSQDTLTRMAEWVNEAQRELEDAHQFRVMEAALTADTVAGTRTLVSKPATWMEEIDAPFYTEKDGNSTPLVWLDESAEMRAVYDYDDPLDKGAPEVLVERETGIEVLPAPDGLGKTGTNLASLAAGEYRITIPYKTRLGALTTRCRDQLVLAQRGQVLGVPRDGRGVHVRPRRAARDALGCLAAEPEQRVAGPDRIGWRAAAEAHLSRQEVADQRQVPVDAAVRREARPRAPRLRG